MNEEEMIYYEDKLLEELSKNKLKRTDILIDLNVALQKYQRIVASIKDFREIQEYKIAVVSIENELKKLQQENQQLKEKLEVSEKARLKCLNKIKTLGKFDGENFTRSFTLWSADFNELAKILDIDKGE